MFVPIRSRSIASAPDCGEFHNIGYREVSIEHVSGAFLALFTGYGLAAAILALEWIRITMK